MDSRAVNYHCKTIIAEVDATTNTFEQQDETVQLLRIT